MREIKSNLTGVVNETRVRGEAMQALIFKYLNIKTYYPFITIGDHPELRFPCIFVDPRDQDPVLETTGKYHITLDYTILWYVLDNNAQDVADLTSSIGENLTKLFSNNALNDLATTSSHSFCSYEPFWTNVQKNPWSMTPNLQNVITGRTEKYMRLGRMGITIEAWVIK